MPRVTLPDHSTIDVPEGGSAADVAARIGERLAKAAVAAKIDGQLVDLATPITRDCTLQIVTLKADDPDSLHVLWHSAAHVMAEAICSLFPETKLVYGPPVENGFYYDIDLDRPITPDDFPAIEARMGEIIKEDRPFTRVQMRRDEAAGLRTAP